MIVTRLVHGPTSISSMRKCFLVGLLALMCLSIFHWRGKELIPSYRRMMVAKVFACLTFRCPQGAFLKIIWFGPWILAPGVWSITSCHSVYWQKKSSALLDEGRLVQSGRTLGTVMGIKCQSPILFLPGCMNLSKLLNLDEPHFSVKYPW